MNLSADAIEKLVYGLQWRIMQDVVRRIKGAGVITSSADWQLNRAKILGNSDAFLKSEIQRLLDLTDQEIDALYGDTLERYYIRDKGMYEHVGVEFIPFEDNAELQQLIAAIEAQTRGEIANIARSLGFSVAERGKIVFKPVAVYYQEYLDRAILDVATGAFDHNTVIKRTVAELANSGIRTVDYASGHYNRATVAVRRAVMTGLNQVTGQITQDNARKLGVDTYEVTYHRGARPTHAVWQGGVYTYDELVSVCGLGSGGGLNGWNCGHDYYPFVPGYSIRTYTDAQLAKMRAEELRPRNYNGKEYTLYEATQRQRQYESNMRIQRAKVSGLRSGGANDQDIAAARIRYRRQMAQYKEFSAKMGLETHAERIYIDGLGRVA